MEVFNFEKGDKLFPREICINENILFHGTHESNAMSIESKGIRRTKYPEQIQRLIDQYREVSSVLNLSHAFKTYQDSYQGKSDIVFLSKFCSGAAGYVRGKSGEEVNTLKVSIQNLNSLIKDDTYLNSMIKKTKHWVDNTWGSDKTNHEKKLSELKNIKRYEPLLKRSHSVMQQYPELFGIPSGRGIVYSVNTKHLEVNDQQNDGYSIPYVTVENIIAKSIFSLQSQSNFSTCKICKGYE